MSSFQTHMLVGSVSGLAIVRALELDLVYPHDAKTSLAYLIIASSAFLATLPDIDEPRSWISRRVYGVIALMTMLVACTASLYAVIYKPTVIRAIAWSPWIIVFVSTMIGAVVGSVLGWFVLRIIRTMSGGHRRLTHSFVVACILAIASYALWITTTHTLLSLLPALLGYAIVVHVLADVVTPAGVPLFYPISTRRFGLPYPLSKFGEVIIFMTATVVGYWLIRI